MARILVTGAAGFLGKQLCARLLIGHEVIGADCRPSAGTVSTWIDVASEREVPAAIRELRPDVLVHAAFVNRKAAKVPEADYLAEVLAHNIPVFHAAAEVGTGVVLVSSSAVYGPAPNCPQIDESCPRKPITLYGVAKSLQEMLAEHLMVSGGLRLCTARLFNLCGPSQPSGLLWADWLGRIMAIEQGAEPVLQVAHCQTARDFVDVRDAVDILARMVDDFRPGECVNVASGMAVSLRELAQEMQTICARTFDVVELNSRAGPLDVQSQCGSNERVQELWGWRPRIHWRTSIADQWSTLRQTLGTRYQPTNLD